MVPVKKFRRHFIVNFKDCKKAFMYFLDKMQNKRVIDKKLQKSRWVSIFQGIDWPISWAFLIPAKNFKHYFVGNFEDSKKALLCFFEKMQNRRVILEKLKNPIWRTVLEAVSQLGDLGTFSRLESITVIVWFRRELLVTNLFYLDPQFWLA